MDAFGKLTKLDARLIWPHEAADFTPWIGANLSQLGEAIGMELEFVGQEAPVGSFSLDILARDLGSDRQVIIENQFGRTDHDHFGKLLTYAAGFDASVLVWIAEEIREEHRQALDWLNQRSDAHTEFFGVVVEVWRIDSSLPAPVLRPVAFPNQWRKDRVSPSSTTKASPRGESYRVFFQGLIDELRDKHKFTTARVAQAQNWYTFTSGKYGFVYGVNFAQGGQVRVETYIDLEDAGKNQQAFEWLANQRESIEATLGPLTWEPLLGKRACRIASYRPGSIQDDAIQLAEIKSWAVQRLLDFRKVFTPLVKQFTPVEAPLLAAQDEL